MVGLTILVFMYVCVRAVDGITGMRALYKLVYRGGLGACSKEQLTI